MKTHRITLPAAWHALALRGVSRLLLPMKPQPAEIDGRLIYCFKLRKHGNAECVMQSGILVHDGPYRAGDRLALLEPWVRVDGRYATQQEWEEDPASRLPQAFGYASRMPLAACRCFYRVVSVEPVRISDISEEHARECGFEDEKVNEFPPVRSAKSPLYEAWLAVGRSGADWAWSVRVEKEDYGMKVGVLVKCELCGHQKKPRGRSGPLGGYYCEPEWFGHGCPGWAQEPRVGDLWPGETEADFGFPVSADGTEEVADANTH